MKKNMLFLPALLSAVALIFIILYKQAFYYPEIVENVYSKGIYPILSSVLAFLFGWIPFSLGEILLYLFVLCMAFAVAFCVFRLLKGKGNIFIKISKLLLSLLSVVSILVTLFIGLWGFNYARLPLSHTLNLDPKPVTSAELAQVCKYLAQETNALYTKNYVPRQEMNALCPDEYAKALSLNRRIGNAKPVLASEGLCYAGIAGIFFPFTGESNVNANIPDVSYSFTVLHELAHQVGFAREDEAGFLAYYVGSKSDYAEIRYSVSLNALIYATNELYKADEDAYSEVVALYSPELRQDMNALHYFWKAYEGEASEAVTAMNNNYLKINQQKDGVKSYGRMVDLLIAYISPNL